MKNLFSKIFKKKDANSTKTSPKPQSSEKKKKASFFDKDVFPEPILPSTAINL